VARPWSAATDGLVVIVRLTPKGGRDAVEGVDALADGSPVLKARVRAAANEGAANAALVWLLAKTIDVAPRRVTLVSGASARIKRLKIQGDGAALAAALEAIVCRRSLR
jgi:uncharacterized protein (TIGR00251 family)